MAWLRTSSDRVVITRAGFSFAFKAGVSREVPNIAEQACLDVGCFLVTDEIAPVVIEEVQVEAQKEIEPEVKKVDTELDEALRIIIDNGDPADFKMDNTPKLQSVNSLLTSKRNAKEIAEQFTEIMNNGID